MHFISKQVICFEQLYLKIREIPLQNIQNLLVKNIPGFAHIISLDFFSQWNSIKFNKIHVFVHTFGSHLHVHFHETWVPGSSQYNLYVLHLWFNLLLHVK